MYPRKVGTLEGGGQRRCSQAPSGGPREEGLLWGGGRQWCPQGDGGGGPPRPPQVQEGVDGCSISMEAVSCSQILLSTQHAGPRAGPWGHVGGGSPGSHAQLRDSESSGTVTPDGQLETHTGWGELQGCLTPTSGRDPGAGLRGWRRKNGDRGVCEPGRGELQGGG